MKSARNPYTKTGADDIINRIQTLPEGWERMKKKNTLRAIRRCLVPALILAVLTLACAAHAEGTEVLKPYSEENGYTYVSFGRYYQSIDGGSPDEDVNTWNWRKLYRDWEVATRKELKLKVHDPIDPYDPGPLDPDPILWRILSVEEDRIYAMSEYVLFASPVHPSMKEYRDELHGDFGQTLICAKLNGEFADTAFTDAEKEALLPFGAYGRVSLPAAADLSSQDMGFSKKKPQTRKAKATEFAIRSTGAIVYRIAVGNHTPYWTREQSEQDGRHARATKQTGAVGHLHCDAADVGARPVVYLNPDRIRITGGSGTKEDPWLLSAVEQ